MTARGVNGGRILVTAGIAAAVLASAAFAVRALSHRIIEVASDDALRRANAALKALEQSEVDKLAATLDALIAEPQLADAFRARDRARLLALAAPRFRELSARQSITHWYFLEPEPSRTCFLRVHAPELHGDVVARETFSRAIETHEIGYGTELGKTAFAHRVVKPFRVAGELVGYMELGEEIDHFLERISAVTGDDFGLLVEKHRVDRAELARVRGEDRWDERPDVVLVDSTMWNERMIDLGMPIGALPDTGALAGEWDDGARTFVGGAFPVRGAGGETVAAVYVRHDVTALYDDLHESRARVLSVAALAMLAFGGVTLVFGRRRPAP
jgi:hypothetical protein